VFYIIAISWCGCVGSSLDPPRYSHIWTVATVGRLSAICLFTLVMCGAEAAAKEWIASDDAKAWLHSRGYPDD
jgi:hypothetical protein